MLLTRNHLECISHLAPFVILPQVPLLPLRGTRRFFPSTVHRVEKNLWLLVTRNERILRILKLWSRILNLRYFKAAYIIDSLDYKY